MKSNKSKKSVVVLTLPFYGNYGGMLQAYALQQALNKSYINSFICKYYKYPTCSLIGFVRYLYNVIKYKFDFHILKSKNKLPYIYFHKIGKLFLRQNINSLSYNESKTAEPSWIVGSDQVWRAKYVKLPFFFLNQESKNTRNKSIAYAASFGTGEWEGTKEETEECAKLLKDFKAVSVREHSGIRICKDIFGVEAVQMPDPTLLLEQDDYNYLIKRWRTKSLPKPFMSIYILDETPNNQCLADSLCKQFNLYPQKLMPHPSAEKRMDRLPLSVPQWLRCIRDCECVLTDSFHGCVFSIIFNKPFICLGNEARGTTRFDSLLHTFGLQERLVSNPTQEILTTLINTPIDWDNVNSIRRSEQQRAFEFLRTNLK